ncbi:MAG: LLM class flavin-dependent oxidoreductase [Acidimicrobiia bacterium]
MKLTLRYDLRAPEIGAPPAALWAAAVEQCAWADRLGFDKVHIGEHHGAEDGYCPSPLVLAGAVAGRTSSLRIHLSALVAVLHHPLRLAEDMAVVDLLSGGRLDTTLGIGYRPHEYVMFGVDKRKRVPILEEIVEVLEKAWTGEPFDFRGTTVRVTPTPVQKPRPPLYIGGSTEASARRAARLGDGYIPAEGNPTLWPTFEAECHRLGRPVPPRPAPRGPLFLHVSDDPERDWPIVAPHLIYTTRSYREWATERGQGNTPYPELAGVDDLKADPSFAVVTPDECVELARSLGDFSELTMQPLMGGLDPDVAWAGLELFESAVLPRLRAEGMR